MTSATPIRPPYTHTDISVEAEPAWTSSRPPYVFLMTRDTVDGDVISRKKFTAHQARQLAKQLLAIADQVEADDGLRVTTARAMHCPTAASLDEEPGQLVKLAWRVQDLLQHARRPWAISPDLVTFKMPHGNHGIAVVVDGGYSQEDAEGMVGFWRTVLCRTLDEVVKVDLFGDEAVGR